MPNHACQFITWRGAGYGASLYYVTAHWVIRCSGNTNGRHAETFIRRRDIDYPGAPGQIVHPRPALGLFPREGGHNGNAITCVLNRIESGSQPREWIENNGVSWATAVAEIDAAILYAQSTQHERASRMVGGGNFSQD
ncbi:hypothetical protein PSCICO_42580 [Pseudomonas cichorii]|uniref:hypothetical protein n=1 Tax=Pseudomonas cichorii TaxID=36746 RepID=UPI00191010AA|nr:hypothetical protein [Pseudomonas cichorii]GFM88859.1 hypothetical protein PSCICO_42580 [Pseudomonas cichorii]